MLKHLTDEEIQLYVIEKENDDENVVQHVHSCELCKAKVEAYQLLIIGIKQQPAPSFGFNLSELVLNKLPQSIKTSNDRLLSWIFISICIGLIGGASVYFSKYISALFKSFGTTSLIYLLGVSAVTIISVLVFDLYRKYNSQIKLLDTY